MLWHLPHLIEAEIVSLERDHLVIDQTHRCRMSCYMWEFRNTLPLSGRFPIRYQDFAEMFIPMSGGIPLPGTVTVERNYKTVTPSKPPMMSKARRDREWMKIVDIARENESRARGHAQH